MKYVKNWSGYQHKKATDPLKTPEVLKVTILFITLGLCLI